MVMSFIRTEMTIGILVDLLEVSPFVDWDLFWTDSVDNISESAFRIKHIVCCSVEEIVKLFDMCGE